MLQLNLKPFLQRVGEHSDVRASDDEGDLHLANEEHDPQLVDSNLLQDVFVVLDCPISFSFLILDGLHSFKIVNSKFEKLSFLVNQKFEQVLLFLNGLFVQNLHGLHLPLDHF